MPGKPVQSIRITPQALAVIALHATKYQHSTVCGFLLGEIKENNMAEVTEAVAVAHETVSLPLLDTAIGLLGSSARIVGWYVAPRLLADQRPDPVSLRVAAQLATEAYDSVLVVVQNEALVECIENKGSAPGFVKSFTRDFGDQWLDEIKNQNTGDSKAAYTLISEALESETEIVDLVDHFQSPTTTSWSSHTEIAELSKRLNRS